MPFHPGAARPPFHRTARPATLAALLLCAAGLSACAPSVQQRSDYLTQTRGAEASAAFLLDAVRANPSDARAWYLLAEAYVRQGEMREADAAMNRAAQISAKFGGRARDLRDYAIGAGLRSARQALEESDPDAAARWMGQVLHLDSTDVDLWRAYGDAQWRRGELGQARQAYGRALVLQDAPTETTITERARLLRNLAVVSLEAERYDEALGFAEALSALPPATGFLDEVPVLRFYAYRGQGDFERAERAFAEVERDDRTRRLRYDRARFALESGRPERSLVDLERLARTPGVAPGVVRLLGEAYHALGDYDGVLRANEYLYRQDPADREALVSLIAAHAALGELEQAEAFRELLRALPAEPARAVPAETDQRDRR